MGLFAWMTAGHFIGDYLLQTNWMARGKTHSIFRLAVHSGVYTASVSLLAMISGGLRWYAILILFISHMVLDQRSFVIWWCKHITKSADTPWLVTAADQSWHILILAAAYALTAG